ncbi:unnamed protein product [Withania somnifera]
MAGEVAAEAVSAACVRCIFRLFGLHELMCAHPSLSISKWCDILEDVMRKKDGEFNEQSHQERSRETNFCKIRLGVLQFLYFDDTGTLLKKYSADDFAVVISKLVKQQYQQIDSFSLEVSLPSAVTENDQAVCSFHIRLTFSLSDALTRDDVQEGNGGNKRRKTGFIGDFKTTEESVTPHVESFDSHIGDGDGLSELCSKESQDLSCSYLMSQLDKVSNPCRLTIHCCRSSIYIGGRYLKYSRNVSQTRWVIDYERMGGASIEEIVGWAILPILQGDNYKFHAAGREDIDVRVKNLRAVGSQGWDLMREGAAEKQKQYAALVWISHPVSDEDLETISSLKELKVAQETPIRVLHRRSPLEREKIIHWMEAERISGSSQYLLLHLCTQAGTYIKEFVHGDLGLTQPSVGSILGCRTEILQLDVTDMKMDCFLVEWKDCNILGSRDLHWNISFTSLSWCNMLCAS